MVAFCQWTVISKGEEVILQSAIVNSKSLKRNIKLVVATFQEKGKKTQTRKMFFSTDTDMKAIDLKNNELLLYCKGT